MRYSIWIEAEERAPGQWTPADDNSDVMVVSESGERWVATFFTYQNVLSLSEKNRGTGENLGGRYLVTTDMILVDELTRPRIEAIVADLVADGSLDLFFRRVDARTYLGGMDALLDGLNDDQATAQLGRLGEILSTLGYELQSGEAPHFNELWALRRPTAAVAALTATEFERQFLAWIHITFGTLPVARQGTGNAWWEFAYGPSTVEFAVISRAGGTSTDWLLRIEEEMDADVADRVQQHFAPGSAVKRRMPDGRRRVQFKAKGLQRLFVDQADRT